MGRAVETEIGMAYFCHEIEKGSEIIVGEVGESDVFDLGAEGRVEFFDVERRLG